MSRKYKLSRRKALGSVATIGAAGVGAGVGTSALFSDEETIEGNTIQAGTSNLIVQRKLVAASNPGAMTINLDDIAATQDGDGEVTANITVGDIKPGDWLIYGTNVIVEDNPMYVAAEANDIADAENTPNPEPEPTGSDSSGGELDDVAEVTVGHDESGPGQANDFTFDPNNPGEIPDVELGGGGTTLNDFLNAYSTGFLYRDPDASPPEPTGHGNGAPTELGGGDNVTHWTKIEVPISVGNEIMGDSVSWSEKWSAEQVRNNAAPSGPSDVDGAPNN